MHIPPAPGFQRSRVGWSSSASLTSQLSPELSERKRTPGAAPSHSGRARIAARLDMPGLFQLELAVLGEAEPLERVHVLPLSVERCTLAP